LLFTFVLEYDIRKAQENQLRLKLNGAHHLPVYAEDGMDNIDIIKKNTEILFPAIKEVGLDGNAEKTKYMLLSYHQNARQNHKRWLIVPMKMCHSSDIWERQ
jgi:hypothetical protein